MGRGKKSGRKRGAGDRYPCGKLRSVHDYGNDRVVALCAEFQPFQGGKADQWVTTSAIGRAWAVGLLDGREVDAAALRDAGLNYAARYWGHYPSASGTSNYGAESRQGQSWGDGEDPRGLRFKALDDAIRSAGRASQEAVHNLVVDHHWFPLENPAWLDRLIAGRLRRQAVAQVGDHERLDAAIGGLMTIVAGRRAKAA